MSSSSPSRGASASPVSGSMTEATTFEGLFSRALKPTGAFADALRAAGYDPQRPEPRYPTRVWHACLEVARRHTFPELAPEDSYRRLGHLFMEGYFATIVGKVLAVGLPLIGMERAMQRLPRNWAASQPDLRVEMRKEGERHYTVVLREPGVQADFCAGLLESACRPTRAEPVVDVVERGPAHCVLRVTW